MLKNTCAISAVTVTAHIAIDQASAWEQTSRQEFAQGTIKHVTAENENRPSKDESPIGMYRNL